jgi:hypothetical protein
MIYIFDYKSYAHRFILMFYKSFLIFGSFFGANRLESVAIWFFVISSRRKALQNSRSRNYNDSWIWFKLFSQRVERGDY